MTQIHKHVDVGLIVHFDISYHIIPPTYNSSIPRIYEVTLLYIIIMLIIIHIL